MVDRFYIQAAGLVLVCCIQTHLKKDKSRKSEQMTLYGFTSSVTLPLESRILVTADSVGRIRMMRAFHKTLKVVVRPLQKSAFKVLVVKTGKLLEWKCVPLQVS